MPRSQIRPTTSCLAWARLAALLAVPGGALLAGHALHAASPRPQQPAILGAQAVLMDAQGREAGRVSLTPGAHGLDGSIDAKGLTPGPHGMHIHTIGKCDAPDFSSAGGHLNPDMKQHGLQNPAGPHQGDLPLLVAEIDGAGQQTFVANSSLGAILDGDGAAFVIHAGPDDMKSDPAGNSGARILCGVFSPTRP
jgi:superoxide dismutase, Cu-Zn family